MRQRTREQRCAGDASRETGEHLARGATNMPGAGGTTYQRGLENQMVNRESVSNTGGKDAHGASGTGELIASISMEHQDVSNVSGGNLVADTPDVPEAAVITNNNDNTVDETPMAILRLEQYFTDNEFTSRFKIPEKFRSEFRFRAIFRDFWFRSCRNHFFRYLFLPDFLIKETEMRHRCDIDATVVSSIT
jgi:hypothetical protein